MILSSVLAATLLFYVPAGEPEQETFQNLETRLSGAIQTKNALAFDELLAKDFAFNLFVEGRAPEVLNRGEWLKTSELYTLTGFEIRFLAVRMFGDVAVVRLQPTRKAALGTAAIDRSGEFAVVDVWTKDGGAWKLSVRHLSRPDTLKH